MCDLRLAAADKQEFVLWVSSAGILYLVCSIKLSIGKAKPSHKKVSFAFQNTILEKQNETIKKPPLL